MRSEADNLYDRLGGERTIAAVVHTFYELLLADDMLKHYFTNTDLGTLKHHQITLLVSLLLGGPNKYRGQNMRKAHAGLSISHEDYDRAVVHFKTALKKYNFSLEDRAKIEALLRGVKPHITHK